MALRPGSHSTVLSSSSSGTSFDGLCYGSLEAGPITYLKDTCSRRPMYWRPISEADLSECLEIQPECLGDKIVGRSTALRIWRTLLDNPAFQANVIESERPLAGRKIVGCGMGVFVAKAFADREIKSPRPGLNSRIIAGIASGEPVVLTRAQIAA